jgi:tetratricopeptide (TPR) repeat protein
VKEAAFGRILKNFLKKESGAKKNGIPMARRAIGIKLSGWWSDADQETDIPPGRPMPAGKRESVKNNNNLGQTGLGPALFILCVLAGLAAFLVYSPSLGNGFVTWDDTTYVVRNPNIRSLGREFFRWAFTTPVSSNYHPLTMITLAIDYAVFGLGATGYHVVNTAWHSIDTALFLLLAARLMQASGAALSRRELLFAALLAALFFGLHPLHVESVAWVSERKDVLSTFFFLLALLSYLRYATTGRKALFYGLALLMFVLSLLSKPMAVTLPVVLLILDYYPLRRTRAGWPRLIIEKIPFFALSAASAVVTLITQKSGGSIQGAEFYSNTDRIIIPIRAYAFYLYKLVLPTGLSPIYPLPPQRGFFDAPTLLSLGALLVITAFAIIKARRGRSIYLAVWLYYLVTLLPVIGFIKVGGQAAADRYTYITTMGFLILAGLFFATFWKRRYGPGPRYVATAIAAAVLIVFSYMTVAQARIWHDPITFWSHIIKNYPEDVPIAYNKRGVAFAKAGAYRLAEADLTEAIRLETDKSFPYYNRAKVRVSLGDIDGAIEDYTALLGLDPGYTRVYFERALLYERTGRYGLAIQDMEKALELQPGLGEAYVVLARLYARTGDKELEKKYRELAGRFFRP